MYYWWNVFITWMKINGCYNKFRKNWEVKGLRCDSLSLFDYTNRRKPEDYIIEELIDNTSEKQLKNRTKSRRKKAKTAHFTTNKR